MLVIIVKNLKYQFNGINYYQDDKEKEKGLPISFMCYRNNYDVPTS